MLDHPRFRQQDRPPVLNSRKGWARNSVYVGSRPLWYTWKRNRRDSLAKMATSKNRYRDVGQVSRKTANTCVSFADICQHLRDRYDHV